MPLDPNEPTSDIGQMYRQYMMSKGVGMTKENLQAVIAQSQREPGMLAGLSVQQAPQGPIAPAPMNLVGASPNSSGGPLPLPPPVPTGIPPSAPLGGASPTSVPNSPSAQALPPNPPPPQQPQGQPSPPQPQPSMNGMSTVPSSPPTGPRGLGATPPPGQAPGAGQLPDASVISNLINKALPILVSGGAGAYGLKQLMGGRGAPVPPTAPVAAPTTPPIPTGSKPVTTQITPGDVMPGGAPVAPSSVAAMVNKGVPTSEITPANALEAYRTNQAMRNASSAPPVGTPGPLSMRDAQAHPAYERRGMRGEVQGPVSAPPASPGPSMRDVQDQPAYARRPSSAPVQEPSTATSPIGNILSEGKGETSVGSTAPSGGDTAHDIERPGTTAGKIDMSKVPMQEPMRAPRIRAPRIRLPIS
jgi:hypothetical protein